MKFDLLKFLSNLVFPLAAIFIALIAISPKTAGENLIGWLNVFGLTSLGSYLVDSDNASLLAFLISSSLSVLVGILGYWRGRYGGGESPEGRVISDLLNQMDKRRDGRS